MKSQGNPNALILEAKGLNTQSNEFKVPPGSLTVAENVEITRDNVIQVSPGFADYSDNLPDVIPAQLFAFGGTPYLHIDNGIWYHDGARWLRKRGNFGAKFGNPIQIWVNSSTNIAYITDALNHVVYGLDLSTGERTVFAGRTGSSGTTDGVGGAAGFNQPYGIWGDGTNIYVCDAANFTIRKIVISTATVSTFAGTAGASGTTDATGASARFTTLTGAWGDGAGSLYVCDGNAIRKITYPGAIVTTFAGSVASNGFTNATGTSARFDVPAGIWGDGTNMYVTDSTNDAIRKVTTPGAVVTTLVSGASVDYPLGIYGDGGGNLYVSRGMHVISKVTYPGGVVTDQCGFSSLSGSADGIGTAGRFNLPYGLSLVDSGASLIVVDYLNFTIRKVYLTTGYVTTLLGIPTTTIAIFPAQARFADGIIVGPP